jgi:PmbA protein
MANDPSRQMQEVARAAADMARKAGAQQAAVGAARVRTVEVEWRDGKLERLKEATTRGLGLELYVDGRYSVVSTSDLRPEAVRPFVETAVAMARKLEADPFRSLPDPKLYAGQAKVDLDVFDPAQATLTAASRRERAQAAEAGAPFAARAPASAAWARSRREAAVRAPCPGSTRSRSTVACPA